MRKLLIVALMLVTSIVAVAQIEEGFRHGVRANFGMSSVTQCEAQMKIAYGAGWVAEYNFNESIFLNTGINLQCIGTRNLENGAVRETIDAVYLQIPLLAGGRVALREDSKNYFFAQVGPQLGIGRVRTDIYSMDPNYITNYVEHSNQIDCDLCVRLGLEFKKFQVASGVDYGLTNTFKKTGHNINIQLIVGYMF